MKEGTPFLYYIDIELQQIINTALEISVKAVKKDEKVQKEEKRGKRKRKSNVTTLIMLSLKNEDGEKEKKRERERGREENRALKSSSFDYVKAHFARICGLQFHLNSIQFPLESVLGACINHLISHF